MQEKYPTQVQTQDDNKVPDTMELVEDEDDEHDDSDEEPDEETEEFLNEAEDLFRLSPTEFQRRMDTFDQRHAHENDVDEETDDTDEFDRATERIPKKKLLKVLAEIDAHRASTGKNTERMSTTTLSTVTKKIVSG